MHITFVILIVCALAAAIYGTVLQSGANLVRLGSRMWEACVISGIFELAAAAVGYLIGIKIASGGIGAQSPFWTRTLAGLLLILAGVRMFFLASDRHLLHEHRMEQINLVREVLMTLRLDVITLICGISCGVCGCDLRVVMLLVFIGTVSSAVGGYVCGRAYGGEMRNKAYGLSGGLLCLVGVAMQLV